MNRNDCLNCKLPECDESSNGCLFANTGKAIKRRWYEKLKSDPVRYEAYKQKNKAYRKRYLKTENGRIIWNTQVRRYRKKHPEVMRAACRRYHERNKEKRLADHRDYMKKRRATG